ncbi:MAG: methyltransferase domain-containing protein [Candidatus Omnitrophota bacterium]
MTKEVTCNLCGKDHYEVLYKSKEMPRPGGYRITESAFTMPERIVKCLGCGLAYVNPRKEPEEIHQDYREMVDEEYQAEEKGRRLSARIILKRLRKFKRKGKLLDIGCATGLLLDEAAQQGWDPYGVELSKWSVDYAKTRFGINIYNGALDKAGFKHNFFDAVVLQDSIEHLTDPKQTLMEIRRILKPDGVLCISTPNIDSFVSKILRGKWWGINQSHLYYFTQKTLEQMLIAAGFSPLMCKSHPRTFTFRYWVYRFKSYNALIYKIFRFITEKTFLRDSTLKIDTADQIEIYARRSRKLQYIEELEEKDDLLQSSPQKMKTVVVLPAYNAARTLKRTLDDIPAGSVDDIILVDDKSTDTTVQTAQELNVKVFVHEVNRGYGGNQKTCYQKALALGADIVVMVHPDYQYDPKAIPALIEPIKKGEADAVFGSRMMKGGALIGGMPLWKHNTNIILTALENVIFGVYLTEYHSGFRAYSARALKEIRFTENSDGFIFDTEIIAQLLLHYFKIEEVPIRTRYFDEASTIKLWPSVVYGLGILKTVLKFLLHTHTFIKFKQFE